MILQPMVKVVEMQFDFMPGKGTVDAVFILRSLQEDYILDKEKKLCMCFIDLEKAIDRVPRKLLEWAMRKTAIIPEVMVRAVMTLTKDYSPKCQFIKKKNLNSLL